MEKLNDSWIPTSAEEIIAGDNIRFDVPVYDYSSTKVAEFSIEAEVLGEIERTDGAYLAMKVLNCSDLEEGPSAGDSIKRKKQTTIAKGNPKRKLWEDEERRTQLLMNAETQKRRDFVKKHIVQQERYEAQYPRKSNFLEARRNGRILAYFDGACEPVNPGGTASYGALIEADKQVIWKDYGVVGRGAHTTSNLAEYAGVIAAFKQLISLGYHKQQVYIFGDSKLVIKQLRGQWGAHGGAYLPYYDKAWELKQQFSNLKLDWIPREVNYAADQLSKSVGQADSIQDILA